jgi:hypothetical protein
MSVECLRWVCYDDSDDAFRQHAYYAGERADQLATGYTAGNARGQKR